MPELPEVLTIKKDLEKEILNKVIIEVEMISNYPTKPQFSELKPFLLNKKVVQVSNVAKLLTVHLEDENILAIHLNMSGRLLYNTTDPFVKIKITFSSNDILNFSSVRMFETFRIMQPADLEKYKKQYGKIIIDPNLSLSEFISQMKKKNTYIKNNLLDQKPISGIGNIYATDALFLSKINPKEKSHKITDSEYKSLFENLKLLINEGILHRGSTIDRYTDLYGKPGTHQKHFRIYGKKSSPCTVCGNSVTFEKMNGRGTYYCENCQKPNKTQHNSLFT